LGNKRAMITAEKPEAAGVKASNEEDTSLGRGKNDLCV